MRTPDHKHNSGIAIDCCAVAVDAPQQALLLDGSGKLDWPHGLTSGHMLLPVAIMRMVTLHDARDMQESCLPHLSTARNSITSVRSSSCPAPTTRQASGATICLLENCRESGALLLVFLKVHSTHRVPHYWRKGGEEVHGHVWAHLVVEGQHTRVPAFADQQPLRGRLLIVTEMLRPDNSFLLGLLWPKPFATPQARTFCPALAQSACRDCRPEPRKTPRGCELLVFQTIS